MYLIKYSKSPYYQIIYFVNGKRTKKSTKKTTEAEAKEFLHSFAASLHQKPVEVKTASILVSEFKEEYTKYSEQSKSKHYLKSIGLSFRQLISYTGDISLSEISSRTLDQFITSVYSRSKSAAGLYHRTLKAAFSKAEAWEYIQSNPFKKIKSPKQVKSLPIFINKVEFQKILDNTTKEYIKPVLITAFYTGMRVGELVNMEWNWVDFNQNIITIKNSDTFTTKSKKERVIPIHQNVKRELIKLYSTNGKNNYVFHHSSGNKLTEDHISKIFKKAARLAGLSEDIHFHTLRHSFASNLVQSGSSLYVVKELLGHQDFSTTQIYSHLHNGNLLSAVNLL